MALQTRMSLETGSLNTKVLESSVRSQQACLLGQNWRQVSVIGVGGTATVYEVEGPGGRRAAAKVIQSCYAKDPTWRRRFQREAALLCALEHPGLPRLYEYGFAYDGTPYLIMELFSGCSLDVYLSRRGGRIGVELALKIADVVLDVLSVIHAARVLHRDLKTANIFITDQGCPKVLDLGIAGLRGFPSGEQSDPTTRGLLGTPAYMPPEQARGRWDLVDERSDLWALGAVLFRALSGEHVHAAQTENEQLGKAMSNAARSFGHVLPDLELSLVRVLDRALAYDKQDRWPSAEAFQWALRCREVGSEREVFEVRRGGTPTVTRSLCGARVVPRFPKLSQPGYFARRSVVSVVVSVALACVLLVVAVVRVNLPAKRSNASSGLSLSQLNSARLAAKVEEPETVAVAPTEATVAHRASVAQSVKSPRLPAAARQSSRPSSTATADGLDSTNLESGALDIQFDHGTHKNPTFAPDMLDRRN